MNSTGEPAPTVGAPVYLLEHAAEMIRNCGVDWHAQGPEDLHSGDYPECGNRSCVEHRLTENNLRALYEESVVRVRPAVWILVCDAGHLPTSTTYATEAAAREVLAMHTTACTGGHTVHLVSPAPSVELVQA